MNTTDQPHTLIRRWNSTDDIPAITALLQRAYAGLARLGLRFHASWQSDAVTRDRLSAGVAWVAMRAGEFVGTVTLYLPPEVSGCEWYDRGDVAYFGQFAVEPSLQRQGIGGRLLDEVERETERRGFANLALDTAEGATDLIAFYERRGFVQVGLADWDVTNYRSVIMNKVLGQ